MPAGAQRVAERFAYATIEALSDHIAVLDAGGTIVAVNRAWRDFAVANSPSPDAVCEGANYLDACGRVTGQEAADAARFAAGLRAVIGGGLDEFSLEYPCHSPTRQRWFIARVTRFEVEGEARAVVTHANVTARRLAEEERERLLRYVEAERSRLDYLFTHAPAFVAVLRGPEHVFEFANPPYLELVGNRDVLGKTLCEALPEIEGQGYLELLDEVFRTGRPHAGRGVRVLLRRGPGQEEGRVLDFVYQPMFDSGGTVSGVFVHGVDVTEHKRAEDRARASEERYRTLFNSIDEGFGVAEVLFDEAGRGFDHRFIEVNPSFEKQSGVPVKDLLSGRTVGELVPRIERHWSETYGRVALTGEPERFVGESDALGRWFDVYVFRVGGADSRRVAVLFTDITERKLAEQRLARSEEQLRALFSASRDGILVEQDERVVYVNDSYAGLFGYAGPQELVGQHVSALVAPGDARTLLEFGRRRLNGEAAPAAFEFKGRRKDGTLLDLEASVSTHTVSGKTYITTTVRDIFERKRAQEALRESEAKYRLLLEQASDGIHTYDLRGNIMEVNARLCEMLGYTRGELLALNVRDLVPPEDLAADPIRFDALLSGHTLLSERRLRRKDGSIFPAEISGKMLPNGVLQAFIRDISERKQAEGALRQAHEELERRVEERTAELARANELLKTEIVERLRAEETLRESEQRLKIALSTGRLGSWQLDLRTLELDASPAVKANFGRPHDADLSREDVLAAIHPEDRARVRAAAREAIAARGDYHAEYRVRWPDGDTRWLISRGRALYDEAGAPLRMVGVTVDVTERRQVEDERKELLRRLVDAQEEERRRISRELHDQLGQRMTALMMGLKTLSAESHGRRSALDGLTALQTLADDLTRELHMLAFGLRPPALDDLGLHSALYNYVEEWAEQARVSVDFHSTGVEGRRLPVEVETALYRIAQEALTNVLKHSGAGRVSVVLERLGEQVVAVIEDDGRGFDAEALLKSPAKGRKLGLLGMRERAAMLGGTLSVESNEGAGTSVFVRIPLAPMTEGAA